MKIRRTHRFNQTEVNLSNGVSFTIVNDFKEMEGPVNSFDAAFNSWIERTKVYTAESFIRYVNKKQPERVFLTLEKFKEITAKGKGEASEEDYLAENN